MVAKQFLYCLQECPRGLVKFGIAVDPDKRRGDLKTGNARLLVVIGYRELTSSMRVCEAAIKERFSDHRIRGEWFRPAPEVLRFVEDFFIYGYPVPWLEGE